MSKQPRVLSPLQRVFGEDFNLPLFISIFKKSLPWMALFVAAALGAVFLYLRYTPQTYQATATLMFQQPEATEAIDFWGDRSEKAFSEIELIRSEEVVKRAVRNLPLEVSYFEKGEILTSESYGGGSYKVIFTLNDSSILNRKIPIEVGKSGGYVLKGIQPEVERQFGEVYETAQIDFVIDLAEGVDAQKLAGRDMYFIINNINSVVSRLRKKLSVSITNPRAGIISISAKDQKPNRASDLVNELAYVYTVFDKERQMKSANSVLDFLQRQIDTITNDLLEHENSIKEFRQSKNIVNPESEQDVLFSQLATLEKQKSELDQEMTALQWIEDYINEGGRLSALSAGVVEGTYQGYIAYINDLRELEDERDLLLIDVGEGHIKVKYLNDRLAEAKKNLLANLDNAKRKTRFELDNVSVNMQLAEGKLQRLPEVEAEYFRLSRLSDQKQKIYFQFKERQTEFEIIKAGIVSNFIVLGESKRAWLVAPRKRRVQVAGLALALVLGLGLVILRYLTQNKILSALDVEAHTNVPLLGVIPRVKQAGEYSRAMVLSNTKSMVAEAFRTIRTNLEFVSSSKNHKTLAVTSTVAGEGKTFVSVNLGAVVSLTGKKVVIVDLDLRKPRVHIGFGFENNQGMSTVLIGKHALDDCILKTPHDNLDVITSGPVPPNSAELIVSAKFTEILDQLKERYDMVVIDTPPVGLVADALELLKVVDVPIYVIRAEFSNRDFLNFPNKLFEERKVPQLCVVLNDVKLASLKYGRYGYANYGYGYHSEHGQEQRKNVSGMKRLRKRLNI